MQTNSIVHGDCLEVLPFVPEESVDFLLFSPSYDKMRRTACVDLHQLGEECYRVAKDGAVCAVVINDQTIDGFKSLTSFRLAVDWVDNVGWKLFETGIYKRNGRPGAGWNKRFRVDHEYVFLFLKRRYPTQKPKHFDKSHLMIPKKGPNVPLRGGWRQRDHSTKRLKIPVTPEATTKCRGTVWDYNPSACDSGTVQKIKLKHPATFPDKLAADLIQCFTKPGELVLDPTVGSGTTTAMAIRHDRQYMGIEIDEKYCRIAEERNRREEVRKLMQTSASTHKPQSVWVA